MNIGFDAKRAYHNQTGLGHYSRTLLRSMATYFQRHNYYLFNPKPSSLFHFNEFKNVKEVLPSGFLSNQFPSLWRGNWVKKDLQRYKIDLYHGLSHEIPVGIHKTGVKSVVTIHDLIHERFPEQYSFIDRKIYSRKFRYACGHADAIIAISEQTKNDIAEFYKTDPSRITVCYQSCNAAFAETVSGEEKQRVKSLYDLPDQFFLYVGSIIERKNLLGICKAFHSLQNEITVPLVVIGSGGAYKQKVKDYIISNNLQQQIIFLSENPAAKSSPGFQNASDFPAIYQQAMAMIYPSFFEGFGIPVLEALWSRIPVITSNVSCLPEAGGEGAFYVSPANADEIAHQIKTIFWNKELVHKQIEKGWQHAQKFSNFNTASTVINTYNQLL
ncbi:MAG: glycosyltransferase family 4 protein [Chitinophagaceae bacterium]|nr:glycosyltransferase family 4 protein [Chitinophagaceae bacterium]